MADLTARGRHQMDSSSFAIPGKRKYPIHDINHARLALAMVSKYGTPDEKAKVRAAVARKYPSIDVSK